MRPVWVLRQSMAEEESSLLLLSWFYRYDFSSVNLPNPRKTTTFSSSFPKTVQGPQMRKFSGGRTRSLDPVRHPGRPEIHRTSRKTKTSLCPDMLSSGPKDQFSKEPLYLDLSFSSLFSVRSVFHGAFATVSRFLTSKGTPTTRSTHRSSAPGVFPYTCTPVQGVPQVTIKSLPTKVQGVPFSKSVSCRL